MRVSRGLVAAQQSKSRAHPPLSSPELDLIQLVILRSSSSFDWNAADEAQKLRDIFFEYTPVGKILAGTHIEGGEQVDNFLRAAKG